jgi:hypothetical protein
MRALLNICGVCSMHHYSEKEKKKEKKRKEKNQFFNAKKENTCSFSFFLFLIEKAERGE